MLGMNRYVHPFTNCFGMGFLGRMCAYKTMQAAVDPNRRKRRREMFYSVRRKSSRSGIAPHTPSRYECRLQTVANPLFAPQNVASSFSSWMGVPILTCDVRSGELVV